LIEIFEKLVKINISVNGKSRINKALSIVNVEKEKGYDGWMNCGYGHA
jgi:hypothetical protein